MAYPLFAWRNAVWSAQRIAIALPVECVFSDASKTTILLWNGIACFYSFEKKKKKHRTTVRCMRNREKKWKSTRVLRDTCSNRPDFVRVVAFDDPSFIKISIPFHILDNYIISLISFDILKSLYHFLPTYKFQKTKKKNVEPISNLIVWLSNLFDCRPWSNEKRRERKKKREKIGGGNATSVIKTRWNTSVDAINLIISHSPISLSFPPTLPPHIYLQLSPYQ